MELIGAIISWVINIYIFIVILRVILDWVPIDSPLARKLVLLLHDITNPLLWPLRRLIPMIPLGEGMAIDISPMVLIILLTIIQVMVRRWI